MSEQKVEVVVVGATAAVKIADNENQASEVAKKPTLQTLKQDRAKYDPATSYGVSKMEQPNGQKSEKDSF